MTKEYKAQMKKAAKDKAFIKRTMECQRDFDNADIEIVSPSYFVGKVRDINEAKNLLHNDGDQAISKKGRYMYIYCSGQIYKISKKDLKKDLTSSANGF